MVLPQINPTTPEGNLFKKILDNAKASSFAKSNDIQIVQTDKGTALSLAPHLKNFGTTYQNYKGEWTSSACYSKYDVVRVTTSTTSSLTKGVWICVEDVPDDALSTSLKGQGWSEGSYYVRVSGRNYNPVWPEPTSNKYWELISMLPETMHICVNGEDKIYYIDAAPSGSNST